MSDTLFYFFDPEQPVDNLSGNLPHWRQLGTRYFVTFRLIDSIPQEKLDQWRDEQARWHRRNPPPHTETQVREFWYRFPERIHRWLDAGYGSCVLRHEDVAHILETALHHFHGERYELGEYVIMPNHVHAVVAPLPGFELTRILHSWKSYSAKQINKLLGRRGPVWQRETFDHIVRTPQQLERINQYIRDNPKGKGRASE